MKELKAYRVNFAGLSEGEHQFEYQIDKNFLSHYKHALIENASVDVLVKLNKRAGLLTLKINLKGSIPAICDLCNEEFDLKICSEEHIVVKFVSEIPSTGEAEVIYLKHGENSINLAICIYEMLMLAIPIRKVHPEISKGLPSCDPTILDLLNDFQTTVERNKETTDSSVWAELRKLKDLDDSE